MARACGRLAAALKLALGLAILAPAAWGAERRLTYIVPAAAGSTDAVEARSLVPDVVFADGSGIPVHLARYRGQVVIVNFWASWCGPCIREMVFLDRLQGDFRGQPLSVLDISEDVGGIAAARAFLSRQKLTFLRPFADPDAAMAKALGVRGLPTSLIIDRQGRLVMRLEGPYEWDNPQIVAQLRVLLGER